MPDHMTKPEKGPQAKSALRGFIAAGLVLSSSPLQPCGSAKTTLTMAASLRT